LLRWLFFGVSLIALPSLYRLFCFGASSGALPCAKPPAAQPPDIPGWSALDAGVACLSRSSLHRQILPASARFGRRVYISASGRQFRYSTLAGLLGGGRFIRFGGGLVQFARNESQMAPKSATALGFGLMQFVPGVII